jgi:hypothetical protein
MALTAGWNFGRNLALGLAVAGVLGGCGSGSSSDVTDKAKAAAHRVIKPVDNHVTALGIAKSTGVPVQVKFDLHDRPKVGETVEVDLVMVPKSQTVDRITGRIETDDGLELLEGGQIAASERPAAGTELHHPIKVRAKRDGIFTFSALLTVDAGGQSLNETFWMPLIAGAGMTDQPGKPATPAQPAAATTATATAASPAAPAAPAATTGTATAAAH